MSTTGQDFVYNSGTLPVLVGSAVVTPPFLQGFNPKEAMSVSQLDQAPGGSGAPSSSNSVVVGRLLFDPGLTAIPPYGTPYNVPVNYGTILGGYAKNGAVFLQLSGTTPQTINLTNTTTNTPAGTAGDTAFSTVYVVRVKNLSTNAITVSTGTSNPSPLPAFSGTTPTVQVAGLSEALFHVNAGATVTTSACNIIITPTGSGQTLVTIGGA